MPPKRRQRQANWIIDENVLDPNQGFVGRGKAIRGRAFRDKQVKFQQHQIFPPNTWLIDLVHFRGDARDLHFWYIFFVEASSRYLIAIPTNGDWVAGTMWSPNTARVKSVTLEPIFRQFIRLNGKAPAKIIGDSEYAFWTAGMMRVYDEYEISTEQVNVSKEGHIRLSILDRTVRTIRQMLDNLNQPNPQPSVMTRVVTFYNNRINTALGYTPKQLHNNPKLQRRLVVGARGANFERTHQDGYAIKNRSVVDVRLIEKPQDLFKKTHRDVERTQYKVLHRNPTTGKYVLSRLDGSNTRIERYRRDIRPHKT